MEKIHTKLFELASPYLDTRGNREHTRIAYEFAARLLDEEEGDPCVVFPAIILHDVGWKRIPEELQSSAYGPGSNDLALNRVHEVEGAKIAGQILLEVHYPLHFVREITEIILGHDSRKQAISASDAVVKDADKLWRYTDHALRAFAERFGMTTQQSIDRLTPVVDQWFLTASGRRMAAEQLLRHESDWGICQGNKKAG
ncbi:MAG: HD domain-containing protein [Syntrophobacteraceae bacterium]|nr:HD domain-containing protein [Syntrophobacteraceae bacterium]